MQKKLFTSVLFINSFISFGQEVVASGGDFLSNANGTFSFTIGEVIPETSTTNNFILTQGFQQSNPISNELPEDKATELSIYPNPSTQSFEIVSLPADFEGEVILLNLAGSIVLRQSINGFDKQTIAISSISQSNYFVYLINQEKESMFLGKLIKIDP